MTHYGVNYQPYHIFFPTISDYKNTVVQNYFYLIIVIRDHRNTVNLSRYIFVKYII